MVAIYVSIFLFAKASAIVTRFWPKVGTVLAFFLAKVYRVPDILLAHIDIVGHVFLNLMTCSNIVLVKFQIGPLTQVIVQAGGTLLIIVSIERTRRVLKRVCLCVYIHVCIHRNVYTFFYMYKHIYNIIYIYMSSGPNYMLNFMPYTN